jgi:hypothetical protein
MHKTAYNSFSFEELEKRKLLRREQATIALNRVREYVGLPLKEVPKLPEKKKKEKATGGFILGEPIFVGSATPIHELHSVSYGKTACFVPFDWDYGTIAKSSQQGKAEQPYIYNWIQRIGSPTQIKFRFGFELHAFDVELNPIDSFSAHINELIRNRRLFNGGDFNGL